jgi:methylenetetrahydrofolate dehydrogenase (NADP+)/methenyltetrahydrofolate cyclohydrolase
MQIINGTKIRDEVLESLQKRVSALSAAPVFCDVLVGNDPASVQYVDMKIRAAERVGISTHKAEFPESISTESLVSEIKKIAQIPHIAGIIVQLPLPSHIDTKAVLNAIPAEYDVDALSDSISLDFYTSVPTFIPPTAAAVLTMIASLGIDMTDRNVVIAGRGMLVGKPVAHLLAVRGISVQNVDSETPEPWRLFRTADVLISAVGKPGLITGDMIKKDVVIIDAGTSEFNGAITGDVDVASVEKMAYALAPVPGGVGPVTVAMLMQNVVISAERIAGVKK